MSSSCRSWLLDSTPLILLPFSSVFDAYYRVDILAGPARELQCPQLLLGFTFCLFSPAFLWVIETNYKLNAGAVHLVLWISIKPIRSLASEGPSLWWHVCFLLLNCWPWARGNTSEFKHVKYKQKWQYRGEFSLGDNWSIASKLHGGKKAQEFLKISRIGPMEWISKCGLLQSDATYWK